MLSLINYQFLGLGSSLVFEFQSHCVVEGQVVRILTDLSDVDVGPTP